MKRLVSDVEQVVANILHFTREVEGSPGLRERLGHVHAWYALRLPEGGWAFGPSKFVGYVDNTAIDYLKTSRAGGDGRETELQLERWASPVDPDSRLGRELRSALIAVLSGWGRTLRKDARISLVRYEEHRDAVTVEKSDPRLLARIVSNPEIAGGRPCIKGTRIRVSDIVGMIAAGVSRPEIVQDYPYLTDADISAALIYAARATDHRVIRAA